MRRSRILNTRGDTIVEVLIAIAVVSSVLGGAFAVSSRALRGTRMSQERGEAAKMVEGQLESLRAVLDDPTRTNEVFSQAAPFCFDNSLVLVTNPNSCRRGPENRYQLSMVRNGDAFEASAQWTKVGGGGQERVTIVYKVYEP
jgi:Tfp pilus assembly protein PilV